MRCVWRRLVAVAAWLVLSSGTVSAADAPPPSFSKDIQPFLNRHCVACHGETKPKAGVRYDSFDAMMTRSRKRSVVPGKPEQSKLVLTMTGKGKRMPPRKYEHQPKAADIEKVKAWVKAGAKNDAAVGTGAGAAAGSKGSAEGAAPSAGGRAQPRAGAGGTGG